MACLISANFYRASESEACWFWVAGSALRAKESALDSTTTAERAAENAHRHRTLMSVAVGLRNQKVRTEVFLLRVRSLVIVPISPPGRNLHPHIRHWKMKRPQLVLKPGKRSIGNYNELEKYLSTNIDLGVKC